MTPPATLIEPAAAAEVISNLRRLLRPTEVVPLSEWADRHRILSREDSAEPGPWRTERAPFQREIMDAMGDPAISEVVFMKSSQVGGSQMINNAIAFMIPMDPGSALMVQPTVEAAESYSKERLGPMFSDTPALHGLVFDAKSRSTDNTLRYKRFPGGFLAIVGANAPTGLASRPIRYLYFDEIDRYPASAGDEGDPITIAERRTTTFWNKKIIKISTPTDKGRSAIEVSYNASDQRKFFVPCPHCGEFQVLMFGQLKGWRIDRGEYDFPAVYYECEHCGAHIPPSMKTQMIARGQWRAHAPFNGVAGFWLNALVSPWMTWQSIVEEFIKAKQAKTIVDEKGRTINKLKVYVNTVLAETYEEIDNTLKPAALHSRRETFHSPAPEGVGVITAGVDVQHNRFEIEYVGWGAAFESWSLKYDVLYGSTAHGEPIWDQLDEHLAEMKFVNAYGDEMRVAGASIDSGDGNRTEEVYQFIRKHAGRPYFAIKGSKDAGKPVTSRTPSKVGNPWIYLWIIGTESAKDWIMGALGKAEVGPGYCHFPADRDLDYFNGLLSEYPKFTAGHRRWVKKSGASRNEALDCRVYAYAALKIINPVDPGIYADALAARAEGNPLPPPPGATRRVRSQGLNLNNILGR